MSGTAVPEWIRTLDVALEPYRVPLLIFLSGILLTRSLKKGVAPYLIGKIKNLGWPYLIWTAIHILAGAGVMGLFSIKPWLGGTTLWYMFFLGIYFFVALVLARLPLLLVAAIAFVLALVVPDGKFSSRLFLLMSYFFVGGFCGQYLDQFTRLIRSRFLLALVPIPLALSFYATSASAGVKYDPMLAPLVLFSIVIVCAVLNRVASGRIADAFLFVGRNALVYYVVHAPLYIVLNKVLFANGIATPYLCIGLALVLGIATPTILAHLKRRSPPLNYLFEGPDVPVGPTIARLAGAIERITMPGQRRSADQRSMYS